MGLSIYLTGLTRTVPCRCICGHEHMTEETEEFYDANFTHNAAAMASEAGIYECLWYPEKAGITKAGQMIPQLESGIALMLDNPDRFIRQEPPNGWGSYVHFVPWLERLLTACREYPDADITVTR